VFATTCRFTFLLLVLALGCDSDTAIPVSVKFVSDFAPHRQSVSVLGVYRDGRMSADAWDLLAEDVSSALGAVRCDAAYDAWTRSDPALAAAVDDVARADGPTDALLAEIAPAASGELIVVVSMNGQVRQRQTGDAGAAQSSAPAAGGLQASGRRARGARRRSGQSPADAETESNMLELTATFYSVRQQRSVAQMELHYAGESLNEAATVFGRKLAQVIPSAHCVGWRSVAQIDVDRLRRGIDN
jgi:hypothetical protein